MTPKNEARLDEIKKAIIPILKRNGVIRAGILNRSLKASSSSEMIFGSYARGEQKKGSDLDILIEIRGKKSLLDIAGLEIELENKLGRKVDLVEYSTIHPLLKDRILKEEVAVI